MAEGKGVGIAVVNDTKAWEGEFPAGTRLFDEAGQLRAYLFHLDPANLVDPFDDIRADEVLERQRAEGEGDCHPDREIEVGNRHHPDGKQQAEQQGQHERRAQEQIHHSTPPDRRNKAESGV